MNPYAPMELEKLISIAVCQADVAALEGVAAEHDTKACHCFTGDAAVDRENTSVFRDTAVFARRLGQKICELAIPAADQYATPIRFIELSVWERAFLSQAVRRPQIWRK